MNEVIYTDDVSGLEQNIAIAEPFPFNPNKSEMMNFFKDDKAIQEMFHTLSLQAMTIKQLQLIETQVKTESLKLALQGYIEKQKIAETYIIYYLEEKGYINRVSINHTAHFIFTKETLEYVPKEFLHSLELYLFGKGYFQKEYEKIDDENAVYKFVIEVKYEENESYIQNITIEKI